MSSDTEYRECNPDINPDPQQRDCHPGMDPHPEHHPEHPFPPPGVTIPTFGGASEGTAMCRSWGYVSRGLPGAILHESNVPTPALPPPVEFAKLIGVDEPWALVRVSYAGLNPGAIFQMTLIPPWIRKQRQVPEMEFCGTVLETWSAADNSKVPEGAYPPPSPTARNPRALHPPEAEESDTSDDWQQGDKRPRFASVQWRAQPEIHAGDVVAGLLPPAYVTATGTGALQEYVSVPTRYLVRIGRAKQKNASAVLLAGLTADALVTASGILNFDPAKHPSRCKDSADLDTPAHRKLPPGGPGDEPSDAAAAATSGQDVEEQLESATDPSSIERAGPHAHRIRILVNGASGGVGHLLLQMLKNLPRPTHITAVCSGKHFALVRSLGADECVDHTVHDNLSRALATNCPDFDFAFDAYGTQSLYTACASYLADHGVFTTVGVRPASFWVADTVKALVTARMNECWPISRLFMGTGRPYKYVKMTSPTGFDCERIMKMLENGRIKVVIDSTWDWDRVKEAYEHLADGHAGGKVVVKVNPDAPE